MANDAPTETSPSASRFTDAQRSFLAQPRSAVVATIGPDGALSQSVVWYQTDGDTLWISARPTSVKARHLAVDPRVSVLVLGPDAGSYVRIEGRGAIDGEVSVEDRLGLISRYVGADAAPRWIAGHPLPSPNAKLRIVPDRAVSYGV